MSRFQFSRPSLTAKSKSYRRTSSSVSNFTYTLVKTKIKICKTLGKMQRLYLSSKIITKQFILSVTPSIVIIQSYLY